MIFHDNEIVAGALLFAEHMHKGQVRANGGPYIIHPVRVAIRVSSLGGSPAMVASAYLHDVIEDTDTPIRVIDFMFGTDVAKLVNELTNAGPLAYPGSTRAQRKQKDRKRLAKVSPEAKLIKLVDRIDNLRDVEVKGGKFSKLYRQESLLLLNECLRGINEELEKELEGLCQ